MLKSTPIISDDLDGSDEDMEDIQDDSDGGEDTEKEANANSAGQEDHENEDKTHVDADGSKVEDSCDEEVFQITECGEVNPESKKAKVFDKDMVEVRDEASSPSVVRSGH